jgi:hypothetical protein
MGALVQTLEFVPCAALSQYVVLSGRFPLALDGPQAPGPAGAYEKLVTLADVQVLFEYTVTTIEPVPELPDPLKVNRPWLEFCRCGAATTVRVVGAATVTAGDAELNAPAQPT